MYCPKCATPLADDAKFCRACGLDLELVTRLLGDRSRAESVKSLLLGASNSQKRRKKRLQNLGALVMMLSFVVGALIPIAIGLGYGNAQSLILVLAGVAGVLLFGGIALAVYAEIDPAAPDDEAKKSERPEKSVPDFLPPAAEKRLPEGDFEPARGVTENTTDLLNTDKVEIPRARGQ